MQKELLREAEQYVKQNQRRRIWRKIVRTMACIVVFCTTYALILPAITMERTSCDLEEHTHGDSCYEKVLSYQATTLNCTYETLNVHEHTPECYDSDGELLCGLADFLVHTHNSSCFDASGTLMCGLPVVREHEHTDDCYQAEAVHEHDDSCYTQERGELVCQLPESEGHVHADACYTQGQLLCTQEDEEHIHDAACYEAVLVCELAEEEAHTHEDSCYELLSTLTCQEEDPSPTEEPELICGLEPVKLHKHDDEECYETYRDENGEEQKRLICEELEVLEHIHDESCFVTETVEIDTEVLTCTESHEHTDRCYGTWVMSCEKEEHTHTEACYPEENSDDAPIIPPECDCGNAMLDLISHADGCARKAFCRETASAYTAVQLEKIWKFLPEDVQTFVLTYLSWTDQQKLAELNGLLPSVVKAEDGKLTIEGKLPRNATVEIKTPEQETMVELMDQLFPNMGEYFSVAEFHDISILTGGEKWQPGATVTVTLETKVPTDGVVQVLHILDDTEAIRNAIADGTAKSYTTGETTVYYTVMSSENGTVTVNADGTISFGTDSFSVFIVNGYNDLSKKELLTPDTTITMKRGDVQYFKWEPTPGTTNTGRGTWTIEAGDEYVDFEVYNSNLSGFTPTNDTRYQYYWLKLTAKEPSGTEKATIQFEYATTGDNGDGDQYIRVQEYFYVQVIETDDALYIDDQVAENGCLVPTFTQAIDTEGFTYEWTRDDGVVVNTVALEEPYAICEGAINIAMDRGGIDAEDANSSSPMKTYTVTVKDGETVVATAEYTVPYGNELLNGSFEYPRSVYVTHDYPNGSPGLYWKTTSESVRDNEICQDIEIINVAVDSKTAVLGTYGMSKWVDPTLYFGPDSIVLYDGNLSMYVEPDYDFPDGVQCAEINCDAPGALYQDILTYPGTSMYWKLNHRARNYSQSSGAYGGAWLPDGHSYTVNGTTLTDQKDYMYVIAAPTDQVAHIKTQDQLNELIRAAGYPVDDFTTQRPTTQYSFDPNGKEVTYNGISFKIWEVATDHTAWKQYASTSPYIVGEGQYLTRFFFAAGSTSHDRARYAMGQSVNYSGGNFIDDVSFSDEMPWQIEYYKDGVLQSSLTESGTVDLNRDTMRYPLYKTASYNGSNCAELSGTTLVRSEINGRPFAGATLDEVYTNHNILRLYFESYGVTVTKEVNITNFDQLTFAEKQELKAAMTDYQVVFELVENGEVVCTVTVTVDPETRYGTATFVDSAGGKFLPDKNKTYVIREVDAPAISGAFLTSKADPSGEITGELVFAHTAVNVYEMELYKTVTILKTDGNGMPLANAEFSLVDVRKDEVIDTVTTADDGSAELSNLRINRLYKLTETKAPAGYYLKTNSVYFTLTLEGVIFTDASGNPLNDDPQDASASGHTITIVNYTGYELPDTGGAGTYLYTMGGALLMAAAILLYIHNLKRRKEERPSF